jgi:hypothetical protein
VFPETKTAVIMSEPPFGDMACPLMQESYEQEDSDPIIGAACSTPYKRATRRGGMELLGIIPVEPGPAHNDACWIQAKVIEVLTPRDDGSRASERGLR